MTEIMETGESFDPQPSPHIYELAKEGLDTPENGPGMPQERLFNHGKAPDAPFPPEGVAVHQMNGVTWTTKDASLEVVDRLDRLYGDSVRPVCDDGNNGGCGATTCYILIEKPHDWIRKRGGAWLMYPMTSIIGHLMDGILYIPTTKCHKCGAASDGWRCGYKAPQDKDSNLRQAEALTLLPNEKEEYLIVFERAFQKGANSRALEQAKGSKSKYQEKMI